MSTRGNHIQSPGVVDDFEADLLSHHESDGSLCDVLDRLLDTGVALRGDLILKVANIDLVYIGVTAILASVETVRGPMPDASATAQAQPGPHEASPHNRGAFLPSSGVRA